MRRLPVIGQVVIAGAVVIAAVGLAACGSDDEGGERVEEPPASLAGVQEFLLDHTTALTRTSTEMRAQAEEYFALARAARFDYAQLLETERATVREFVETAQGQFAKANPEYEQMEGVVAGVPELAEYDVIIDAGSDASDPENAVPFDIETTDGRTFKQPGNLNYLIETSVFGTEPKFAAKGVKPDLDGDGRVEFGEAVPDAAFYLAAAREFERQAKALDGAAERWQPSKEDAFTALVVMTPTMSEYFEAWKNSRFVAGARATEKAFVVSSRLQDIGDILGGLVLVYDSIRNDVAQVNAAQAEQTGESLRGLQEFVAALESKERDGRKYTAEEADTLGAEAQTRAEAIAGQISQAAGQLDIRIQEG